MFVWLDIGRCLYVKLLLVLDLNKMQLYVCLARHCQLSISKAATVKRWNKSSCMFVWLGIAGCLYVKLLLLKDENKSSDIFVWLDIARCLFVKRPLLKDENKSNCMFV